MTSARPMPRALRPALLLLGAQLLPLLAPALCLAVEGSPPPGGASGPAPAAPAGPAAPPVVVERLRVIVPPVQAEGAAARPLAPLLYDGVKSALLATDRFVIASSGKLDAAIDAAVKSSNRDSVDQATWIQLGSGQGAQKLVQAELKEKEGACYVSLVLVDLTRRLEEERAMDHAACKADELLPRLKPLARQLAGLKGQDDGDQAELTLRTYVLCRRPGPKGLVDIPDCTQAELRAGDQVKFAVEVDRVAYLYILNNNEQGQFQSLYPAPGEQNVVGPGAMVYLPAGGEWLELDEQSGVTEHIHVVAAPKPLMELERLRGVDVPAQGASAQRQQVDAALGMIAPFTARGFKLKKGDEGGQPSKLTVGKEVVATLPLIAKRPGVNVIEFQLRHR